MDEIITRWATDLAKYQKEFLEQAEQVAQWDRMLVENGTKVQKLYGSTVDAERATQEVERQLASVEGQQEELSSWLDRYEQEVETLSNKVGLSDTLQGPDQERERTYVLLSLCMKVILLVLSLL
jgi:nuclear pore complex protein Nup62